MKSKLLSEFLGTAFLVMIVLGSGIMASTLFPGQSGSALFVNSVATGAGLFVLIQTLGPISGCHINPVVTLVEFLWKRITGRDAFLYIFVQFAGAYLGIVLTHIMFNLQAFEVSHIERSGSHLLLAELIATFGLICVIALSGKKHVEFAPLSVAAYITSGYWFTSSTSFVNPAVTFARGFTNTFGGMSPAHYLPFTGSQVAGALLAWKVLDLMQKSER